MDEGSTAGAPSLLAAEKAPPNAEGPVVVFPVLASGEAAAAGINSRRDFGQRVSGGRTDGGTTPSMVVWWESTGCFGRSSMRDPRLSSSPKGKPLLSFHSQVLRQAESHSQERIIPSSRAPISQSHRNSPAKHFRSDPNVHFHSHPWRRDYESA